MKLVHYALVAVAVSGPLQAAEPQFFGEYRSDCDGRELTVWGTDGDLRVQRGDESRRAAWVRPGSQITWFCDGNRREFFCQESGRANHLELEWRRSGPVTFYCQRR